MTLNARTLALTIPCPQCYVPAGQDCTKTTLVAHPSRQDKAARLILVASRKNRDKALLSAEDAAIARAADLDLEYVAAGSCPRAALVNQRHTWGDCWCETRINDHGARYTRGSDGRAVIMWEPYEVDGIDLADVIAAATADGIDVTVTGASSWNPGETFAVIFTAKGAR